MFSHDYKLRVDAADALLRNIQAISSTIILARELNNHGIIKNNIYTIYFAQD
jgi:hypothetical protein